MTIILSQRIDKSSDYDDIPYYRYNFPKRYRNQIKSGDIFIYYQGDRWKRENRYYFGYGVIGSIEMTEDGERYFAYILDGESFQRKVPIYNPEGGFYESLGYNSIRTSVNPSWQNSIRKISEEAFNAIINAGGIISNKINSISEIESNTNPIETINNFNNKYNQVCPEKRKRFLNTHIDRGTAVTNALKQILGARCQVCGLAGFEKRNGERYIEAHHLIQLAFNIENSLCSDNVILVCPNCHSEIHYGRNVVVEDRGLEIYIKVGLNESIISKNSLDYLSKIKQQD